MQEHAGKCRIEPRQGQVAFDGPCRVALGDDSLMLMPDGQRPVSLYYSDMETVADRDHAAELAVFDGRVYTVYFLGAYYGQFLADLRRMRGAQLTRNLLMLDAGFEKEFRGAYSFEAPDGRRHADRGCKISLFRSSLVVEPDTADMWNLSYADIEQMHFDSGAYSLALRLDLGEQVSFRMLGTRFGELEQEIRRLTLSMYARTAALLKERLPGETREGALLTLAQTLRQGKAVRRDEVATAVPGIWPALEKLLFTPESGEADPARQAAFAHLCSLAKPENIFVGLRESYAEGEAPGEPVYWFVIAYPKYGRMAVEVTNESGNATYVYRLDGPVDRCVKELSRAMVGLNFRRDVISASEEQLAGESMARYRVALRKLPYVRRMRDLFVGKAAHSTDETWRRRMGQLLQDQ